MIGTTRGGEGWRIVDIVVAAVIAAAFGVVFWAWGNLVWPTTAPLFAAFWPSQYLISGIWLMPAVLGAVIIRRPGAALFTEVSAALVSALLGAQWGFDVVLSGFAQGAGAELAFAFTLYRLYNLPVAALAGVGAAIGEWLHDIPLFFPTLSFDLQLAIGAFMLASGAVVAGVGSWLLMRAMAETGVLAPFPSGREQRPV
jgi:energy-coupling factor transport system substrate-specific component